MPGTVNTKWFRARLEDRQLSQRDVARQLNRHPSAVSLMLQGKRRMQITEATALATLLGVPLDSVLDAAGLDLPAPSRALVPLVGWADLSGDVHRPDRTLDGPKKVERPVEMPDGTSAVRFQNAGGLSGWAAYFVPSDIIDPHAVGRLSIAETVEGKRLMGVLSRSLDSGRWSVSALCGARKHDRLKLKWACPVVWIRV